MNLEEINRYLTVGSGGILIDCSKMDEFFGRVREITLISHTEAMIEFNVYDQDDGGPKYIFSYPSLEVMVESLESYLGKPVAQWHNFNRSGAYPAPPKGWEGRLSSEEDLPFATAVFTQQVKLPEGECRQASNYWKSTRKSD